MGGEIWILFHNMPCLAYYTSAPFPTQLALRGQGSDSQALLLWDNQRPTSRREWVHTRARVRPSYDWSEGLTPIPTVSPSLP